MNRIQPTALITGASSGIGETFARKLSQNGYRVILVARRKDRLENLAKELGNAEVLAADLSIDKDLLRIEEAAASQPGLEMLVNNAGFGVPGRFYEPEVDKVDRMHRVHIIAIERLTHAALRIMVPRDSGSIINVSSVAGFFHTLNSTAYCASKAWINNFSEGLYLELKNIRSRVRVQALCPGLTYTEFHDVIRMDRNRVHKSLWMTSDAVVDESLRSLKKNRLFVIPGWRYRLFVAMSRCLPRSLKHRIAIGMGDRHR